MSSANNKKKEKEEKTLSEKYKEFEKLDPEDENYEKALYEIYNVLPEGWNKREAEAKDENGNALPPFYNEDGRTSWKHPGREELHKLMEKKGKVKKEEEKDDQRQKKKKELNWHERRIEAKFQKMLKSGVPRAAVERMAKLEGVDLSVIFDDIESDGKSNKDNNSKKKGTTLFRICESNKDQVEFPIDLTRNNTPSSYLPTLVRKLVQTVNKRGGGTNSYRPGSFLTVGMLDLYNALGALHGVRRARDMYNSSLVHKEMSEVEVRAKQKTFLEHLSSIGASPPSSTSKGGQRDGEVDIEGLDDLIGFIEEHYEAKLRSIREDLKSGMYDFDSLAELYKPSFASSSSSSSNKNSNEVVAQHAFASSGIPTLMTVSWCRYEQGKTLFGVSRTFRVCFEFVVSVGEHFTICEFVETMEDFQGRRSIRSSLPYVPMWCFEQDVQDRMRMEFRKRGEMYNECGTKASFLGYSQGSFYAKGGGGGGESSSNSRSRESATAALRTDGRAMVDIQGAYDAGYSLSVGYDPIVFEIKSKYKEYMLHKRRAKQQQQQLQQTSNTSSSSSSSASSAGNGDVDGMILFQTIPEEYLQLSWPAAVAFSFTSKTWGDVLIDGLSPIQFDETIFDSLVLPPTRKRMIKALVRHSSSQDDTFHDIVSGKGEGSVFLLYGPPGVGKTLTAEAISEMLHKPLYMVSLGQLGTTPSQLESKLGDILDLCGKWDALILLDEADIFLEKRTSDGSLERNAMVSVMLRLVEYFKGTLFLTSNRVDSLDPAFKTRITLALRYDSLDFGGRVKIWTNLLIAAGFGHSLLSDNNHDNNNNNNNNNMIHPEALAQKELNGREIKNAIRLSMALAKEDGKDLSQDVLLETVNMLCDFNEKMNTADAY